jgi:hypothetical protein
MTGPDPENEWMWREVKPEVCRRCEQSPATHQFVMLNNGPDGDMGAGLCDHCSACVVSVIQETHILLLPVARPGHDYTADVEVDGMGIPAVDAARMLRQAADMVEAAPKLVVLEGGVE